MPGPRTIVLAALLPVLAAGVPQGALAADALSLVSPIDCVIGDVCQIQQYMDHDPGPGTLDYHCGAATYDGHDGTDFRVPDLAMQKKGVRVLAGAAGRVLRVRDGMPDRPARLSEVGDRACGNGLVIDHGAGWQTQYCHLAQGSVLSKPGDDVVAGQPLGLVGYSGAAEFPHLHLTVRYAGQAVDPFAFQQTACGSGQSLWTAPVAAEFAYQGPAILNLGLSDAPVDMAAVEEGTPPRPQPSSPRVFAYGRAINLDAGDRLRLKVDGPGGFSLLHETEPVDRRKAQVLAYSGRQQPPPLAAGSYWVSVDVVRAGRTVASKRAMIRI